MIRDITLGQYYTGKSVVHRLDPRLKIIGTFVYLIMLFFIKDFIGYAAVAVCLAAVTAASRVPVKFIIKGMKPILFILIFTFIINIFLYDGTILWQWKFLTITDEGIHQAVFIAVRLILLIFGTSLLTYTTKPMELTDGFEAILRPLSRFGVPSHEIATMMSIALRFIPTLLLEADKIMKAQQARGADFESGNLVRRAKSMIPLLVPLFISAFRIAQDLASAMEARCYRGGEGRTRLHPMKYHMRDAVGYVILTAFAVFIFVQSRGILPIPMIWAR
ncbi:MAG: energy-coupling factor transporter transmembrane protein EcfT [Firmicutes bacterium]|nr:energy-coupling factor transporter transmembrane protein EcfT [Bacillota bacterium]